jgi:hypothetical protein
LVFLGTRWAPTLHFLLGDYPITVEKAEDEDSSPLWLGGPSSPFILRISVS